MRKGIKGPFKMKGFKGFGEGTGKKDSPAKLGFFGGSMGNVMGNLQGTPSSGNTTPSGGGGLAGIMGGLGLPGSSQPSSGGGGTTGAASFIPGASSFSGTVGGSPNATPTPNPGGGGGFRGPRGKRRVARNSRRALRSRR